MKTKTKYGKVDSFTFFVMSVGEDGEIKTPTVVFDFNKSLEVNYNYNCEDNTWRNRYYESITKKEFDTAIAGIKSKFNVEFTIKAK